MDIEKVIKELSKYESENDVIVSLNENEWYVLVSSKSYGPFPSRDKAIEEKINRRNEQNKLNIDNIIEV